jgi:hypothetical protein
VQCILFKQPSDLLGAYRHDANDVELTQQEESYPGIEEQAGSGRSNQESAI